MGKRKPNNYYIENGVVHMELRRRNQESLWTIFDEEDLDKVIGFPYSWHADYNKNGHQYYAAAAIHRPELREKYCSGGTIRLHSFLLDGGCKGMAVVDHINGNSLDNRRINLRLTGYVENALNRKGCNLNNGTGIRNVCEIDGKYMVQLQVDGNMIRRGPYTRLDVAARVAENLRNDHKTS